MKKPIGNKCEVYFFCYKHGKKNYSLLTGQLKQTGKKIISHRDRWFHLDVLYCGMVFKYLIPSETLKELTADIQLSDKMTSISDFTQMKQPGDLFYDSPSCLLIHGL